MNVLSRQKYTDALRQTSQLIAAKPSQPGAAMFPVRAVITLALFEVSFPLGMSQLIRQNLMSTDCPRWCVEAVDGDRQYTYSWSHCSSSRRLAHTYSACWRGERHTTTHVFSCRCSPRKDWLILGANNTPVYPVTTH